MNWAEKKGARYAELNYGSNSRRRNFWARLGFVENGVDEWGEPLMIRPPTDKVPIKIEVLAILRTATQKTGGQFSERNWGTDADGRKTKAAC